MMFGDVLRIHTTRNTLLEVQLEVKQLYWHMEGVG